MSAARIVAAAACGFLAAACAGPLKKAPAPVRLAYGGNPGEVVRYEARMTLRGQVVLQGMPQLMVLKSRVRITDRILNIEKDGHVRLRRSYSVEYLEVNGMKRLLDEKMRSTSMELIRSSSGRVAATGRGEEPIAGGPWSNLTEVFFPVLPEGDVQTGSVWKGSSVRSQVTFEGEEALGDVPCAILAVENGGEVAFPEAGVERVKVSYSGRVHFPLAGGSVRRGEVRGRISGKMRTNEMDVSARMEFTSRLDPVAEE